MRSPSALLSLLPAVSQPALWPRPVQWAVVAATLAILAVSVLWLRAPDYKVLFSGLSDRDGGAIVTALAQMNVPYSFSDNGNALLVPADKVHETRLRLAEQGLPRNGDTGFELLDKARFGVSQFTEQINYQRALEGELANSVQALSAVQAARVHLALPRESVFVRDRQPPSASVLVTLYPGRRLSDTQTAAIAWLISASVPHLSADQVSIVDQNGQMLTTDRTVDGSTRSGQALIADIEQRAAERILALLTPLVGSGNVRAQVTADVDFTQREQTLETFGPNQEPDTAAVRSRQTRFSSRRQGNEARGVPGALSNQVPADPVTPLSDPEATAVAGTTTTTTTLAGEHEHPAPGDDRDVQNDTTTNYEVDRTIQHVKEPAGKLRRLSVAVVVNDRTVAGERHPLSDEVMAKLQQLVKEAVGFDETRGDSVSVINSPFADDPNEHIPVWLNPLYIELATGALRYLLFGLVAWLLWRKLLKPILHSHPGGRSGHSEPAGKTERELHEQAARQRADERDRHEDNLTTARKMAESDPRAVAMVVRSWMQRHGQHE